MKIKQGILFIIAILLFSCSKQHEIKDTDIIAKYESLSINEIDTIKMVRASINDYKNLTNYAIKLQEDTLDQDKSSKGIVLLAVIAAHLEKELKNKDLDATDKSVDSLIKKYESFKYFIYQPKISNFIKLARKSCNCDYPYIYSRFRVAWYFYPLIILSACFIVFSLAIILGWIKWKFRKRYSKILAILGIIFIVLTIIFFKTCDKYVKEHSFYGIRF